MRKKIKNKLFLVLSGSIFLFSVDVYSHSKKILDAPENSDFYDNGMPAEKKVE